jgi:hypothetical protein
MARLNNYYVTLIGILGAVIFTAPISHYITIPYMPWRQAIGMALLFGVLAAPVFLFCTFLIEQVNKRNREDVVVASSTSLDGRFAIEAEVLKFELDKMVQHSHSFDRPVLEEVEQSILKLTKLIRTHFNSEGVA